MFLPTWIANKFAAISFLPCVCMCDFLTQRRKNQKRLLNGTRESAFSENPKRNEKAKAEKRKSWFELIYM